MSYIDNTRAAYRVLDPNGFFGPDDTLYTVDEHGDPAEIYFDGEPNEQLEPLNELARERLVTYLEKLDSAGREAATKLGKPFIGRPRTIDGAIVLATELQRSNVAIMGAKKPDENMKVERVEPSQTPETGSIKRSRGRPSKKSLMVAA